FNGQHETKRAQSFEIIVLDVATLWLRKRIKHLDRWHERKQVQHRRTRDEKLLLIRAVIANRIQCYVFADAVVEDAEAATKHGLRRTSRSRRGGSRRGRCSCCRRWRGCGFGRRRGRRS